jgi:hypothetical protein
MIFEYFIQMSSPRRSLGFRESLDTSAGESTKILQSNKIVPSDLPIPPTISNIKNKYVTFSNNPFIYYYNPQSPSNSNYTEITNPEVPIVYLTNNQKCSNLKTSMITLLPILTITSCLIILVIFFIIYFN